MNPAANQRSADERHFCKPPNTITSLISYFSLAVLAQDPDMQLENTDFDSGQDSTILVRERTRKTKLDEEGEEHVDAQTEPAASPVIPSTSVVQPLQSTPLTPSALTQGPPA